MQAARKDRPEDELRRSQIDLNKANARKANAYKPPAGSSTPFNKGVTPYLQEQSKAIVASNLGKGVDQLTSTESVFAGTLADRMAYYQRDSKGELSGDGLLRVALDSLPEGSREQMKNLSPAWYKRIFMDNPNEVRQQQLGY